MTKDYNDFLDREKRRHNHHVREERRRRLAAGKGIDFSELVFPALIIGVILWVIAILFLDWQTMTGGPWNFGQWCCLDN